MSFDNLGLSKPILKAVAEKGYSSPSPIQQEAIPAVLSGKDVMAAAQTGTGKTASFTLPILERLVEGTRARSNQVRVLALTPTRELAAQVGDNIHTYSKYLNLKSTVVYGGVKINPQMMRLRKGADILVATPGRLLDLYEQNALGFEQLEMLVLDEADRMLDMGFIRDIRKILVLLPEKRQNLMFSATFSNDIRKLAKTIVRDPVEISVAPPNSTVDRVKHWMVPVDKKKKPALLMHLISDRSWDQVLVFSRTKHGANRLATLLTKEGINAAVIHGNKSQGARTKALAEFKAGKVHVLVATDIAARGIDISQLPYVVNLDLPHVPEDYVHRIGRTGRAGAEGEAISLVSADEHKQLVDIERLIKKLIPREYEPGFEPGHEMPESKLDTRPLKPKKPKKPKKKNTDGQSAGNEGRRSAHGEGRNRRARHSEAARPSGHSAKSQRNRRSDTGNQKPRKPKPILDEDGNVNGNVAGVETHQSDRNNWLSESRPKKQSKRSKAGRHQGAGKAKSLSNQAKSNQKRRRKSGAGVQRCSGVNDRFDLNGMLEAVKKPKIIHKPSSRQGFRQD